MPANTGRIFKGKGSDTANRLDKKQVAARVFQQEGNRAAAITQRKLQQVANGSAKVKQLIALQKMADGHAATHVKNKASVEDDALPQGKFVQLQEKESSAGLHGGLESGIEHLHEMDISEIMMHQNADGHNGVKNIINKPGQEIKKAPHCFIVADHEIPSAGQIRKSDFLNALKVSVTTIANAVLAPINQTAADCPYISYWFAHYKQQQPAYIERALNKYAPGSVSGGGWQGCIHVVSARIKTAFQNHVHTGSLAGVPDDVPKSLLPIEEMPAVQLHKKVAQLCSSSEPGKGSESKQSGGPAHSEAKGNGPVAVPEEAKAVVPNNLPPWGSAVTVGYRNSDGWDKIKADGVFTIKPEGSRYGPGLYVGPDSVAAMYTTAGAPILEVGYIGETSGFIKKTIRGDQYDEDDIEGKCDILEVTGAKQTCYKLNGPGCIKIRDFRFRERK